MSKHRSDFSGKFAAANVVLFSEFPRPADVRWVEALEDAEIERHLALCKLAILRGARIGCLWADLPQHPIGDYNTIVYRELEALGFKITHPRAHWNNLKNLPPRVLKELHRRAKN